MVQSASEVSILWVLSECSLPIISYGTLGGAELRKEAGKSSLCRILNIEADFTKYESQSSH